VTVVEATPAPSAPAITGTFGNYEGFIPGYSHPDPAIEARIRVLEAEDGERIIIWGEGEFEGNFIIMLPRGDTFVGADAADGWSVNENMDPSFSIR